MLPQALPCQIAAAIVSKIQQYSYSSVTCMVMGCTLMSQLAGQLSEDNQGLIWGLFSSAPQVKFIFQCSQQLKLIDQDFN